MREGQEADCPEVTEKKSRFLQRASTSYLYQNPKSTKSGTTPGSRQGSTFKPPISSSDLTLVVELSTPGKPCSFSREFSISAISSPAMDAGMLSGPLNVLENRKILCSELFHNFPAPSLPIDSVCWGWQPYPCRL